MLRVKKGLDDEFNPDDYNIGYSWSAAYIPRPYVHHIQVSRGTLCWKGNSSLAETGHK